MNYLKTFNNNTEYESDQPNFLHPHVSYIKADKRVIYEKTAPSHDYSKDYLTFEALSATTIGYKSDFSDIYYSVDSGSTWLLMRGESEYWGITGTTVPLNAGDTIMFKSEQTPYTNDGVGTFTSTGAFSAMGNPLSMIYGDNFSGVTAIEDFAYKCLFMGNQNLVSAEHLALTATTLAQDCYYYMFYGCTSLTKAPALPATTLANFCYYGMFNGCTSLATAPELPATTLANDCYYGMFSGCTSLTTAPELPAATLVNYCYREMFKGCTSLNNVKMLATDISASQCLASWLYGVSATGTFTKNSAMSSLPTGASGIPSGWTVINA